ncbi:MAG: hydroxyacid dehydrogenase [Opitutaceae bacterium]|jgi:phosphoglycerate dehydrogenase-like enzyme|nr:hydroxyacid dehydrogenase [Opitutaceae bacterium]
MAHLPLRIEWTSAPAALTAGRLKTLAPEILVSSWSTPPLPEDWLADPECSLRYVCHLNGSVKALVPRRFIERGGLVSNWGGMAAEPVAEHALLLALAALRNLGGWPEAIRRGFGGEATCRLGTRSLFERRVGIHGFGAVVQSLMRLLRPFRVEARAYSQGVPESMFLREGVTPCSSLSELFSWSEVLFECEGLTPSSESSVDAAALAALPDGAVFVNVARGRLVDEAALLREASSGRIRLALDVVRDEPLSPESPLYRTRAAVLSPHIGGPTSDMYPGIGCFALANIARYVCEEKPEALVTPEIYDRAT